MCISNQHSPFAQRHAIYNESSGTFHNINCKSWSCPECSKIKISFMKKGLATHFADNRGMRMMTVTLASGGYSVLEHAAILQKSMMYFVKNLRRNKALSELQRTFKYVRVVELHKGEHTQGHAGLNNGYIHYHIIVDRYLPIQVIQPIFEQSVLSAGYNTSVIKFCNINIKLIPNVKCAVNYVISYILKATDDFKNLINKWSKSRGTPIYTHSNNKGIYIVVPMRDAQRFFKLYLYFSSQDTPNDSNNNVVMTL